MKIDMANPFSNWSTADVAAYNARTGIDQVKPGAPLVPCGPGVEREADLHDEIERELKRRGWMCFHGSMAHRAMRTLGEPDYTILADGGRVFFFECKTKTGKLSTEQRGIQMWAQRLGHTIYTVRSLEQFLKIVDNPTAAVTL